jgi:predicted acetyltransferase
MERMTDYEPDSRPSFKEIEYVLGANICRFEVLPVNVQTGEKYPAIVRNFTGSNVFKFKPETEYVYCLSTLSPLSTATMLIPFRLVKKQYVLELSYAAQGRWNNVTVKTAADDLQVGEPSEEELEKLAQVPKMTAALKFCDVVYGIEGDTLFCETDGYTYEMGLYEYKWRDENRTIGIVREGEVAVPERLEARVLSILREVEKTITDLFCVVVYAKQGEVSPAVIKAINDSFPEAIRIYQLGENDLKKGAILSSGTDYTYSTYSEEDE